jgi:hypothetical protein
MRRPAVPDHDPDMDGLMKSSTNLIALTLIAFAGLTACNGDAEPDPAPDAGQALPQQQMDPEAMALMTEAQQIQQQLQPIQQQAMQDEALAGRLADLQTRIEAAMREENPDVFEQMEAFEADFMAAQEAGDQERAQAIAMEAQGTQQEIQSLQQTVLERPEIREPIEAFEEAQRARMIEIDPEAGELMDRMDEILAEMATP